MRHDVSAADMIAMIGAGAVQTPRGQPMAVVRRQVFRVWDESRLEGRSFGPQGQMPLIGQWAVGVKAIRREHPSNPQFPHSAGRCRFAEQWNAPLTETACITCNTYSAAYKGKPRKNAFLQNHRIH